MPLPVDVKHGTEPTLRRRLGRWFRRAAPATTSSPATRPEPLPDSGGMERDYWAPRSDAPARVAELLRAHEQGEAARPRGNPAFSEALFVELMRARQYRRAFDQLSDDCKQRWGSAENFAAAQGSGALRRLRGVTVKEVRFLPEWNDPEAGRSYREVAELQVEYTLAEGGAAKLIPRTVHLVPHEGKWRSLCYP